MPTNEERREVAARLRELNPHEWGSYNDEYNDLWWACLCDRREYCGMELHERLADLIEPEPERTCSIDRRVPDAPFCSRCAYDWNDDWNYCPTCGAKVVEP